MIKELDDSINGLINHYRSYAQSKNKGNWDETAAKAAIRQFFTVLENATSSVPIYQKELAFQALISPIQWAQIKSELTYLELQILVRHMIEVSLEDKLLSVTNFLKTPSVARLFLAFDNPILVYKHFSSDQMAVCDKPGILNGISDVERLEFITHRLSLSKGFQASKEQNVDKNIQDLLLRLGAPAQHEVEQIIKAFNSYKYSEKMNATANEALRHTYALLNKQMTVDDYETYAKTIVGNKNPKMAAIGWLLLALSSVVLTLGIAAIAVGAAVPAAGVPLMLGGGCAMAAGFTGIASSGFFSNKPTGPSKAMQTLAARIA